MKTTIITLAAAALALTGCAAASEAAPGTTTPGACITALDAGEQISLIAADTLDLAVSAVGVFDAAELERITAEIEVLIPRMEAAVDTYVPAAAECRGEGENA